MTQRLSPDIDRMLWEVAESQDQNAYDDFEARFPNLVGELGKRIQLVRELRGARGNGSGREVPRFDRRAPARVGLEPRAVVALCAAAVACIGLGAYAVTARVMNHSRITPPETVQLNPPALPLPNPNLGPSYVSPQPQNPPAIEQPAHVPDYLRPQTLTLDRAKLQSAILMVAASGRLDVEFAPNMPNPEIRMAYKDMNAIDILKDLGPRFGFTAFKSNGNHILVIPKADPNLAQLPPATGSGYAANLESDPAPDGQEPGKPKKAPSANSAPGPS